MKAKLSLNLDLLTVDSFPTVDADDSTYALMFPQRPTSSPCLNSEQTCDPACIA